MSRLQLKPNDPPIYRQLFQEMNLRSYEEVLAEVTLQNKDWSAADVVAAYDWDEDEQRDDIEEEDDFDEIDDDEDDEEEDEDNAE